MIALITDFGTQDIYVGVMKAVIAEHAPSVVIVDVCHEIAPHDVRSASFALRGALPYFAQGTVIVVVVDPGVGSQRLPIAVRCGKSWILAPNNGIVSGIGFDQAVRLDNPATHRQGIHSVTFHGRDVFAPAAAALHNTRDISSIGSQIDSKLLVNLERSTVSRTDTTLGGDVQHVDRFGNVITNITPDILTIWSSGTTDFIVSTGSRSMAAKRASFYSELPDYDGLLLIANSFGLIEIASNCSSASEILGDVRVGQLLAIKRS